MLHHSYHFTITDKLFIIMTELTSFIINAYETNRAIFLQEKLLALFDHELGVFINRNQEKITFLVPSSCIQRVRDTLDAMNGLEIKDVSASDTFTKSLYHNLLSCRIKVQYSQFMIFHIMFFLQRR